MPPGASQKGSLLGHGRRAWPLPAVRADPSVPSGGAGARLGVGQFRLEGPLPAPRVEFRAHCPHSPGANTQPLFPGPWRRGGEGASAPSLARKPARQVWPAPRRGPQFHNSLRPSPSPGSPGPERGGRRGAGSNPTTARAPPARAPPSQSPLDQPTQGAGWRASRGDPRPRPPPGSPEPSRRPRESPPRPGRAGREGEA